MDRRQKISQEKKISVDIARVLTIIAEVVIELFGKLIIGIAERSGEIWKHQRIEKRRSS